MDRVIEPPANPTQYVSDRLGITHEQLGEALHEINALKALRRELVDPKIAKHHGRIVKTTGDGMLMEFASIVGAVRCAVEVQWSGETSTSETGSIASNCASASISAT
jgi:class 3 adenylate cyclase